MSEPELSELAFGARLRALRERSGKSRPVLGGLVGRSSDWVKALENGRLLTPRMPMLVRLAEALDVQDLSQLTGSHRIPLGSITKAPVPGMDAVTQALLKPTTATHPIVVDELVGRVDMAWGVWHGSTTERTAIAAVLPDLVGTARATTQATEGLDRRRARAELARVYHLVQLVNAYQPAEQLSWLSADRAYTAAQEADDPDAQAIAAWYYAHLYRSAGQADMAVDMLTEALGRLAPGDDPASRSVLGIVHLGLALAHAKAGRAGAALGHWDTASDVARRLPAGYTHPWLLFGVAAVDVYRITVEADLCRFGEAEQVARNADYRALPSHTRRAFFLIEQARRCRGKQDDVGVVYFLGKALRESLDTTRHHPIARAAVVELVGRPGVVGEDARELALVIGLEGDRGYVG
ncbi:helix-turn-helix domain-containing protein [Actinoplanes bogorensis]|uniref:Helix-turn-helix domain-containing protein n=1 Tax=Paractinoplanes bogorensis TaxID=1610840 RepID=A0ABS5YHH4_9ACTN|nr:helix-turn-helix transcriptional regulator [Actinoplanes bogorensis]MBU2662860.1 helix-turn-helix domain-containing protein [Actinoplanes bogorensis]